MTATEDDEALALRGYLISRTGCLPTEPAFQELSRNETLLRFTVHWLQKRDNDMLDAAMKLLGVCWDREDVEKMGSGESPTPPKQVFLPLALGCNAQLGEQLRTLFRVGKSQIGQGEYQPQPGEEVVELGELPIEEFKRWASAATGLAAQVEQQREQTVTLGSESEDPRIERMREQIAHSKRIR